MQKYCWKLTLLFVLLVHLAQAQSKFLTKQGHASFFSEAPLENIEAHNYQVMSVIDLEKSEVAVSMLIKTFEFEKSLMQEHFNENYMESDQFPKSTFKGSFTTHKDIEPMKNGLHEVNINGQLTIHGVTKSISTKGTIEVKDGKLIAKTKFPIALKDHNIKVPNVVIKNIAEVVEVSIDIELEAYKS